MKWVRNPIRRVLLALLTAVVVVLYLGTDLCTQPLVGFWGILYPQYCFSVPLEDDTVKNRFTFRWLRTPSIGDKIGEKYQSECSYDYR